MPVVGPDELQVAKLVELSIQSLDNWQQKIAQRCPFVSPWPSSNSAESSDSEDGSGDAGAEAGKRRVPERSLLYSSHGDHSGDDASVLRDMAEMEEIRERRLVRTSPLASGVRASELSIYRLKGWQLLHRIIVDGLSSTDAPRVPPCVSEQRVYLLLVDETERGKLVLRQAVNIDACPRNILMTHLDQVEKRGWRDIIWVGNERDNFRDTLGKDDGVETMVWG